MNDFNDTAVYESTLNDLYSFAFDKYETDHKQEILDDEEELARSQQVQIVKSLGSFSERCEIALKDCKDARKRMKQLVKLKKQLKPDDTYLNTITMSLLDDWRCMVKSQRKLVMRYIFAEGAARFGVDNVRRVIVDKRLLPFLTDKERMVTLTPDLRRRPNKDAVDRSFKRLMKVCGAIDMGGAMLNRILVIGPSLCTDFLKGRATLKLLRNVQR